MNKLIEALQGANSLQAVISALGVALLTYSAVLVKTSKISAAGCFIAGVIMIAAPNVLPSPKIIALELPPSDITGNWQVLESSHNAFDGSIEMAADGKISGIIPDGFCPVSSNCLRENFKIDGAYEKSTGHIKYTRRNLPNNDNPQEYNADYTGSTARGYFKPAAGNGLYSFILIQGLR